MVFIYVSALAETKDADVMRGKVPYGQIMCLKSEKFIPFVKLKRSGITSLA